MDYEKLQEIFSQARIYLGCSISDGISTSFLESLVAGAYPIQTVTSCANEWINKGADATLVKLDVEEIRNAIEFALINDEFVDTAQAKNMAVAKTFLNNTNIRLQALSFYS
jgi:glycosyltransferase involved in cell wall biosynthesis